MPGGDVTITLNSDIEGILTLGDYVAYDTSSLSDVTVSGRTASPSTYTGGWRVLSNDGTTVKIISATSVAGNVTFSSSGVTSVTTVCAGINNAFLNGTYASAVENPPTFSNAQVVAGVNAPVAFKGTYRANTYNDDYDYYIQKTDGTEVNTYYKYDDGSYFNNSATAAIRPVITLKSDLCIASGSGTSSDPYILSFN